MPIDRADAKLMSLIEMAQYDWLDAHPRFQGPLVVAVFGAGFDAGAAAVITLITSGKWNPYRHAD